MPDLYKAKLGVETDAYYSRNSYTAPLESKPVLASSPKQWKFLVGGNSNNIVIPYVQHM